jgi:hypothetical protein
MSRFLFAAVALVSWSAFAEDFTQLKTQPEKTPCEFKNGEILFSKSKLHYKIYEATTTSVKSISCEKIEIQGLQFYSAQFTSLIDIPSGGKKILTYEAALLDKKSKSLKTVRSEVVDQNDLSADAPDSGFTKSFAVFWGQSQKDKRIMLKITETEKNEKPFTFFLKLNAKKTWFENIFK